LGGVKIILDETTGHLHPPQDELNRMVLQIHRAGLQVAIHAIEEDAVESACTAIENALVKAPRSDHRHRIEHCSICLPELSRRIASLGIRVVTQPPFLYFNGERYLNTVPSRQLDHLYPVHTLKKEGVKVAGSSDCPIVPPDPLIGIYAATSRASERGNIIGTEEKISSMDALLLYTLNAAQCTFEESIKGSITPGKFADLIMLDGDPTQLPPEEVLNLTVMITMIDGEVLWEKSN
jgi:predicted amidohydrolase YtcJ